MTTIPAVKAALVALAQATLPNSQVIYGPISAVTTTTGRVVSVGRVVGTRELDSLAFTTSLERYTVDLAVSVDFTGTDQRAADEAALADYEALAAAIFANVTLGLAGTIQNLSIGEFQLLEQSDADGRHAAVLFAVSVVAQN